MTTKNAALKGLKINYTVQKAPALDRKTFNALINEAKTSEFTIDLMIGKDIAAHILSKHNPKNRKIHDVSVSAIARDMSEGRWKGHVGDEITDDNLGHLNNGQHRLSAIVQTGLAQKMSFRFGLDESSRLDEGRGRPKQFSDFLAMQGSQYKHRTSMASAVRLLYGFLRDYERPQSASGNAKPTNGELNEVMNEYGSELYESLTFMKSLGMLNITVDTSAAVLHFLFKNSTHGKDKADEFFEALATGAGLESDSPILVVRNRLTATATAKLMRQQSNKDIAMALIAKAWNAWTADKKWSSKERTPAYIPHIDGLEMLVDHEVYKKEAVV